MGDNTTKVPLVSWSTHAPCPYASQIEPDDEIKVINGREIASHSQARAVLTVVAGGWRLVVVVVVVVVVVWWWCRWLVCWRRKALVC